MARHWIQHYFEGAWIRYYGKAAQDFFYHTAVDHADACQEAQLHLYERLAAMDASPSDAYVKTAYKHHLINIYRRHFGRSRPPKWVQCLGPLWVELWELFCNREWPFEEIVKRMSTKLSQSLTAGEGVRNWVKQGIRRLREADACAKPDRQPLSLSELATEGPHGEFDIPDQHDQSNRLEDAEIQTLLRALVSFEDDVREPKIEDYSRRLVAVWGELGRRVAFNDDERLMLRLRFQEEMPLAKVAGELHQSEHRVRRHLSRVLARIRAAFEEFKVGGRELIS